MLQSLVPGLGTYPAFLGQEPAQPSSARVVSALLIPSPLLNTSPLVVKPLTDPDLIEMPDELTAIAILKKAPLPAATRVPPA